MSTDPTPPKPSSPTRTVVRELQGLIQSLLGLYSQVSSRMLSNRMETRHESTAGRDGMPIEDLLGDHIERTAAESAPPREANAPDNPTPASPDAGRRPTASAKKVGPERSGLGLFGALSSYFGQHRSSAQTEPYLREKMRKNTLDHINKALMLAKQGDAKGAKVHAGLAESAMQTAGDYMNDEEYAQFKAEVDTRLQAAKRPHD